MKLVIDYPSDKCMVHSKMQCPARFDLLKGIGHEGARARDFKLLT